MPDKDVADQDTSPDGELSEDELSDAAGGIDAPVQDANVISPRDAASGLPTGKRMHKPFTID